MICADNLQAFTSQNIVSGTVASSISSDHAGWLPPAMAAKNDELMIVTAIPDQAARHQSYALLARAWGLGAASQAA